MYLEVTLIKPCTFSRFLKGRHNICRLLFRSLHSYPVFSTAYSGSLPPWLSPLPKSGKQSFRFCLCSNTISLLHYYSSFKTPLQSEKDQNSMFSFCPSPLSPVAPRCLSVPFFFKLGGGTDWPCKNDTVVVCAEYSSSIQLTGAGNTELRNQTTSLKTICMF